jgi:signal transduction histidine kinase
VGCGTLLIILSIVLLINNRYAKIARKELEQKNRAISDQALELRNLNLTKDKLFSIISHDLRSPVAGLKSLMDLIDTPGLSQDEFVKITKVLKRNLDYVHEDLDNLLMWAQTQLQGMQALQEPVRLKLLAEEKISLVKDAALLKKISISNEISPDAIVYADRNHISLVLRNLIGNAIKFNEPGGCIKISSKQKGTEYEISVSDSGVGIVDDDMNKLFRAETHFTRPGTHKEKGLGIGLLLTKEFVEINRGSIWVESEEGRGTTFTFTLQANTSMMTA